MLSTPALICFATFLHLRSAWTGTGSSLFPSFCLLCSSALNCCWVFEPFNRRWRGGVSQAGCWRVVVGSCRPAQGRGPGGSCSPRSSRSRCRFSPDSCYRAIDNRRRVRRSASRQCADTGAAQVETHSCGSRSRSVPIEPYSVHDARQPRGQRGTIGALRRGGYGTVVLHKDSLRDQVCGDWCDERRAGGDRLRSIKYGRTWIRMD